MELTATRVRVERRRFGSANREVLEQLCDPGTFRPLAGGDGTQPLIAGVGSINGRRAACYATDGSCSAGALGAAGTGALRGLVDRAANESAPVVGFLTTAGADLRDGAASLDGFASLFSAIVQSAPRAPQISVVVGACAGGGSYAAALTDVTIMTRKAALFLTGPGVVREAIGEQTEAGELGGWRAHRANGVGTFIVDDGDDAVDLARCLADLFAAPARTPLDPAPGTDPSRHLPPLARQAYDVRAVIRDLVDSGELFEADERWARNMVTGFARLHGRSIGVVANQPRHLSGVINVDAALKAARFIRLCTRRALPLLVLVDTPGFMPGRTQESAGIIRAGAELVRAFIETPGPTATLVLRKAYGGAYIAMNSRQLGADLSMAWPDAELGIMARAQANRVLGIDELDDRQAPVDGVTAAARGHVHEAVEPTQTRRRAAAALGAL